ncbi:MAG: SPFH domain-containing protein, partial [Flavobacteriales bacterium]
MKEEKTIVPKSGWGMLLVILVLVAVIVAVAASLHLPGVLTLMFVPLVMSIGFFIVNPNQST